MFYDVELIIVVSHGKNLGKSGTKIPSSEALNEDGV